MLRNENVTGTENTKDRAKKRKREGKELRMNGKIEIVATKNGKAHKRRNGEKMKKRRGGK